MEFEIIFSSFLFYLKRSQYCTASSIKVCNSFQATAEMMNIGQMPRLRILYDSHSSAVNITGGPLRPYKYRLQRVDFHYSNDEMTGSEHAINSRNFPMEVSFYHPLLTHKFL